MINLIAAVYAFSQSATPWPAGTSPLPAPTGHVNDYAGVMDAATKQQIETRLREFKARTDPQVEIAVAVVKTTGGRDIFDYSLGVARGWGIGSKESDNPGALLLVAIDDRKYFTQISKDLEDELPDGIAGSLQRQFLVPEFRKGNYAKGISDTVDAYIRTIESKGNVQGTPQTAAPTGEPRSRQSVSSTFCCLLIVIVVLFIIFSNRGGRGGRGGGGGGLGGALPWIIGSAIANSGSSSSSSWGGGGGSSWGGGGGSWGGFGGGGDFGGGGAGGGW